MVDAKTRLVALAVLASVGLSGCEFEPEGPELSGVAGATDVQRVVQRDHWLAAVAE